MTSLLVVCPFFSSATQKHAYLETLRHCHRCNDQMCISHPRDAGQYQSEKTDEPSNKDSIFRVWSPAKNDKSQQPTATGRVYVCKHSQAYNINIDNPLDSLILVLAQHKFVGRKCGGEIFLIKGNQGCICFRLYKQSTQKLLAKK